MAVEFVEIGLPPVALLLDRMGWLTAEGYMHRNAIQPALHDRRKSTRLTCDWQNQWGQTRLIRRNRGTLSTRNIKSQT